jgi:hypothetical protein
MTFVTAEPGGADAIPVDGTPIRARGNTGRGGSPARGEQASGSADVQ